MSTRKLIAVFGATGGQGGSVFRAIQGDAAFRLRAITRNKDSDKGKALAATGAEVVSADQNDPASLVKALEGAHGVFAVTNFWEHMDTAKEIQQGKNIADACKVNNVEHVVFSSLESFKDAIGKEVPFFDTKAVIEAYMKKDCGLNVTAVKYPFFLENFFAANKPRKEGDTYVLDIPLEGKPLHSAPSQECGEITHQIFKQGSAFYGKDVGISTYHATIPEYAAIFTKVLGKPFKATTATLAEFSQMKFPGVEMFSNMFEGTMKGVMIRDVALTKSLDPNLADFETWLTRNKDKLLAVLD